MIRRASFTDLAELQTLLASVTYIEQPFKGTADTLSIELDTSAIALIKEDEKGTIQGFICFGSCPPIHQYSHHQSLQNDLKHGPWDDTLGQLFVTGSIMRHNTLFVWSIILLQGDDTDLDPAQFMQEALRSTFTLSPRILHIAILYPKEFTVVPEWMTSAVVESTTTKQTHPLFVPIAYQQQKSTQEMKLLVSFRSHIVPALYVRPARVEDCDDLVPLFKRHNMLPAHAGDYQVSEILESRNPNVISLVAEVDKTAVAFISVSTEMDIQALIDYFPLDAYWNITNQDSGTLHSVLEQVPNHSSAEELSKIITAEHTGDLSDPENTHQLGAASITITSETAYQGSVNDLLHELKSYPNDPVPQTHRAFAIRLFCIDDRFVHQSSELISPIFHALPNHDYCLLTQPTETRESALIAPSGGGGIFIRIPPRPSKYPNHCLYLTHRLSSINNVRIDLGTRSDMDSVISFLSETTPDMDTYRGLIEACYEPKECSNASEAVFVVKAAGQVVGVSVIHCSPINKLITEFDVEHWIEPEVHLINGHLNSIKCFVLNPLFECHTLWILQDIMQLAETSILVYECTPTADMISLKILRDVLIPLRPRRVPNPTINHPVWMLTSNYVFEPKITINDRLLFVGASDCNLSTIESLIFNEYARYTNLILVSPEGYINPKETFGLRTRSECVGYPQSCLIIQDKVSAIKRETKRVRLRKGGLVKFDRLVLSLGKSYTDRTLAPPSSDASLNHVPNLIPMDACHIHHLVNNASINYPKGVVVVGADLMAFHAVSVLLQHAYPPEKITHIVGPVNKWPSTLTNLTEHIVQAYKDTKIRLVLDGHAVELVKSSLDRVTGVNISTNPDNDQSVMELVECELVILANEKLVSTFNFRLVQDAYLVFDEGLVISSTFCTNDPNILASGTCTKFSRKEQIAWTLNDVSSKEVGKRVSAVLSASVDPNATGDELDPLQPYTEPVEQYVKIANKLDLYTLTPPHCSYQENPVVITTHVNKDELLSHVELVLNKYSRVSSFKYFGTRPINSNKFFGLYNVHEKYLSRLVDRFNDKLIDDLFDFLNQAQFNCIFSDRFQFAMEHVRTRLLANTNNSEWKSGLEKLARNENPEHETLNDTKAVYDQFEASGDQSQLADMARRLFNSAR